MTFALSPTRKVFGGLNKRPVLFVILTLIVISPPFGRGRGSGISCAQQSPAALNATAAKAAADRPRYQINLTLDVERGSYTGGERVRWTNRGDRGTSVVFFHLYSNVRSEPQTTPTPNAGLNSNEAVVAPDEPRIEVTEVRSVISDLPLFFNLDDQGTTLRIEAG